MSQCGTSLAEASMPPGFCAFQIPVSVNQARSILSVGTTRFLALERGLSRISLLHDTDDDGVPDTKTAVASASGLNHGLAVHDGYLYASSSTTVFRWVYSPGEVPDVELGSPEIVIVNMNADGSGGAPFGHTTRTLAFDGLGRLYVSIGSAGNVDQDSFRSRIRRFDLNARMLPIDFVSGEVFADGLRNEVGLAFDRHGVLWGVENGADNLFREDLGGDVHNDNPAEELNRFPEEQAGEHWGYPYCWTEYGGDSLPEPPGLGRGTVWAWESFMDDGYTDDSCRQNFAPPEVSMQGHSAPLGITFYEWKDESTLPAGCTGAFPREMDRFAFIAFHGSWNRSPPTGYKVVYVAMNDEGRAVGEPIDLLSHTPPSPTWDDGFRPVDVAFDDCGRLIVSSDGSKPSSYVGSKIVRMSFESLANTNSSAPSVAPTLKTSTPSLNPSIDPTVPTSPRPTHTPTVLPSANPDILVSDTSDSSMPLFLSQAVAICCLIALIGSVCV